MVTNTNHFHYAGALVILLLTTSIANAEFRIAIESDAGHHIAGGQNFLFDDDSGSIIIEGIQSFGFDQGYRLSYSDTNDPTIGFGFKFSGPDNTALAIGNFPDAQGSEARDPGAPYLSASGVGSGCNRATGHFEIKEVVESADRSTLLQFAADLVYFCEERGPELRASIRVNSVLPLFDGEPNSVAGPDSIVSPADVVRLDGSASRAVDGSLLQFSWRQVRGVPVVLGNPSAAVTQFTAPTLVSREYEFLEFELTTTDTSMRLSTDTIVITVSELLSQQSFFNMNVEEGAFNGLARVVAGPIDLPSLTIDPIDSNELRLNYIVGPEDPTPERFRWSLTLSVPEPHLFAEGIYYNARRAAFSADNISGIDFNESGHGCNKEFGSFVVREAAFANNGAVDRLAVDFVSRCSEAGPAISGILRVNSVVPDVSRAPTAAPGPDWTAYSGDTVTLDGQLSSGGLSSLGSYSWQQIGGQSVPLSDEVGFDATFPAPVVSAGEGRLDFDLTVTNAAGYSDTEDITITVLGPDDPKTHIRLIGDPDNFDFILNDIDRFFNVNVGTFEVDKEIVGFPELNGFEFNFRAGTAAWRFALAPRAGEQLEPGVYTDSSNNILITTRPYLSFSGDGRGCSIAPGDFVIHELERNVDGTPERFAIDFSSMCGDVPPAETTTGIVRYNSTIPDVAPYPVAAIVGDGTIISGTEVVLDSADSYGGPTGIVNIEWQQIGGPQVPITDPNTPQLVIVPELSGTQPIPLQFQLTITTGDGLISTSTFTVTVIPDGVPYSALKVESDAGDPIGSGRSIFFDVDDAEFKSAASPIGQARIRVTGTERWDLRFDTAFDDPLIPGNYEGVFRPDQVPSFPGMSVVGDGTSCVYVGGRFVVHEAVVLPDYTVSSLAVDFEQFCDFGSAAARGSIRFNSAVPLILSKPNAAAGRDAVVAEMTSVPLNGLNSMDGDGLIVNYLWQQVSGTTVTLNAPTSPVAFFIAPDVSQGREVLEFELSVFDDDGNSDTDIVAIEVLDVSAPRNVAFLHQENRPFPSLEGNFVFNDNNAYFRGYELLKNRLRVDAVGILEFGFEFAGPNDTEVVEGERYTHTALSRTDGDAYMALTLAGTVCNYSIGWFEILELQKLGDELLSLAADYQQSCNMNVPPFVGSIRFNSVIPPRFDFLAAFAGVEQQIAEGRSVMLAGDESYSVSSTITRYTWRVVDGPSVVFSGDSPTATFVAPVIPTGAAPVELTLELEIEDRNGAVSNDELVITIGDNEISGFPEDMLTMGATNDRPFGMSISGGDLVYNEVRGAISGGDPSAEPDNTPYSPWLFRVLTSSGSATLTLHSLDDIAPGSRWTSNSVADGWQPFVGGQTIAADRQSISIELTDGGPDDHDGIVNGTIEISGTLGIFYAPPPPPPPPPTTQPPPSTGGGGGSTAYWSLLVLTLMWIRLVNCGILGRASPLSVPRKMATQRIWSNY